MKRAAILTVALAFAAGAAQAQWLGWGGPGDLSNRGYTRGEARIVGQVMEGEVVSSRAVRVEASTPARAIGATTGGAIGGIVSSGMGQGNGRTIATILGGLAGAVAGDMIAQAAADTRGVEVLVRLKDGRLIAVVQEDTGEAFSPGEPVYLISTGQGTRVVRK
ncbi:glycine zipper 2TM domain-containing protein [Pelomicrobium methylotrophicum]|uniref:Glycine zipper 2TM domain-containing protein n=1 Tax=Pelomicrobium methylotrophicum TaxID=2602750 RepID=A0A5C7ETU9_9PROT|nr:glycine zipper 2TM domain-containing protein [Pelomicrobium methylotrophicum]TXF11614.1 glycine zipper 2TM domain-containing protein [Pelomicrobium methylotrophicum]